MSSNALLWPSQGTKPEERLDKYKWLKFPSQGVGGVPPVSEGGMGYEPANWFDAAFQQRIPLTINSGQVPSTQSNVPLLINDIYPDLIGEVEAELRFAGTDLIPLPYEIEKFDNSTGELIAWVLKPSVSDSDIINIYFDNPIAVDEQNPLVVWGDYEGVYHLNQTTFGANSIIDSTGNGNDGTDNGTITSVPGKIGNGINFGALTVISLGTSLMDNMNAVGYVSMWFNFNDINNSEAAPTLYSLRTPNFWEAFFRSLEAAPYDISLRVGRGASDQLTDLGSVIVSGANHHLAFFWDQINGVIKTWFDGDLVNTTNVSWTLDTTAGFETALGNVPAIQVDQEFDGILDEARFANDEFSDDRVKTEFNNQNSQSTFYSTDTVESVPAPTIPMAYEPAAWFDAAFQQRIPLTINSGQVPTTQTNFPLLINDTFPDLIGEVEAELRIVDETNTPLDYEIQEFDNSTGLLIAWARKPTLSDGNVISIYFDNPGAVDAQDPAAVWISGYAAVWHLSSLLDSTSNSNDLTNFNSTPDIAGKIGVAKDFNGIDQLLEAADSPSLSINGDTITLSAWIDSSAVDGWIMGKDEVTGNRPYSIRRDAPILRFGISSTFLNGAINVTAGQFSYVTATYDGSQMRTYVNGVPDTTLAKTGNVEENAIPLCIGRRGNGDLFFDGIIDECRISNVARSDDYIETEFNNQNSQSTFYSTGTVESVPAATITMRYEE